MARVEDVSINVLDGPPGYRLQRALRRYRLCAGRAGAEDVPASENLAGEYSQVEARPVPVRRAFQVSAVTLMARMT